MEQLEERLQQLSAETDALLARINALSAREKKLKDMILHGENVKRVQPLIDQMNSIHWKGNREKFRATHQGEIDMYYISKRYLEQQHHISEINIPAWKEEQESIRMESEKYSAQYKHIRDMLNQMLNVRNCVKAAKGRDKWTQKTRNNQIQR